MQIEDADKEIKKRFMTEWALVGGGVPYVFDNDVQEEGIPSYIRLSVNTTGRLITTQGVTARVRQNALINVKVNAPVGQGPKGCMQMVSKVITIFEKKRFGQTVGEPEGVSCAAADPLPIGSDGQFWSYLVAVDTHWYSISAS